MAIRHIVRLRIKKDGSWQISKESGFQAYLQDLKEEDQKAAEANFKLFQETVKRGEQPILFDLDPEVEAAVESLFD